NVGTVHYRLRQLPLQIQKRTRRRCPRSWIFSEKSSVSLYVYSDTEKSKLALARLGKFKMGKACIYVKKLTDIHIPVLQELCKESIQYISQHHECSCRTK